MSKPIPVMLDRPLLERIDKLSEKMGEARSTVMRIAMRLGLTGLERTLAETPERLSQDALRSAAYPEHRPAAIVFNEPKPKPSSAKDSGRKLASDILKKIAPDHPKGQPPG